jgi:multidrug efflux pump subunit AcrA (membrane-fusion protein)
MRQRQVVPIIVIVVVVAIGAGLAITFIANPAAWQTVAGEMGLAQPEATALTGSGFMEAEEVAIAPEMGGRVLELLVAEGDDVAAGQPLVRLDGTLLDAQIEAAQAALDLAEAQLTQARAGPRPESVRRAEADMVQTQTASAGAYQAWQDLVAIRDNAQRLDALIAQAAAQVASARAAVAQAVAVKDAAEIAYDAYWDAQEKLAEIPSAYQPGMQMSFHLIPNAYWKAWVGVNAADAAYDGAVTALANLRRMRDDPQDLEAQILAAEAEHRVAKAAVQMAQAQLDGLKAGATAEEIRIAEAQVDQARAALATLTVLRGKQAISAPVEGVVLAVSIHEGELAVPGGTMLTLGDLDQITLKVYLPQDRVGQVTIGQPVEVRVDSFPGRTFEGRVVAIADRAEFTPRNVQTQEERVSLVFAVDVRIENPDHALKPGLPADASIVMEAQ